jgi:hypothetical protein
MLLGPHSCGGASNLQINSCDYWQGKEGTEKEALMNLSEEVGEC